METSIQKLLLLFPPMGWCAWKGLCPL